MRNYLIGLVMGFTIAAIVHSLGRHDDPPTVMSSGSMVAVPGNVRLSIEGSRVCVQRLPNGGKACAE